jgi:adenosylcobinamide-phosphate guanylyltransferase
MKVAALIMAGGKGERMGLTIEKPLLTFLGKPIVERVIEAVESAQRVSEFSVVTSKNTPETENRCLKLGLKVIRTDGRGYHDDLKQAVLKARLSCPVLTISSDLPALRGTFLDRVISFFEKAKKDAVTVLVPMKKREELNLSLSSVYEYNGQSYAVSGINIIDGAKIFEDKIDEFAMISEEIDAVLNVNTLKDMEIAQRIVENAQETNGT